jgi:hypothetical protein
MAGKVYWRGWTKAASARAATRTSLKGLEVRDDTEALHHRLRLVLAGELDHELREDVHDHVVDPPERVLEERHSLLDREQRLLVGGVPDHTDDDAVEDRRRATDDVDVPVGDGVVRAGADCDDHRENTVMRAEP